MNGIVLVISGPAGVGKTTLCDRLLIDYKAKLSRVVTVTTRLPREGEKNGKDYLFISKDEFKDLILEQAFIEYAQIHDNYYGSLKKTVQELFHKNHDVLLNIDVQGASSLKNLEDNENFLKYRIFSVFIMPSSLLELKERLKCRGLDTDKEIEKRLTTASNEVLLHDKFDFVIKSKSKSEDYAELSNFYSQHSKILSGIRD